MRPDPAPWSPPTRRAATSPGCTPTSAAPCSARRRSAPPTTSGSPRRPGGRSARTWPRPASTSPSAPVADVNTNPDNPVIGVRSFGSDPARAGEHVAAWVRGLQSAGVAACAKHFPGHGDTSDDSHLTLPVVHADLATLDAARAGAVRDRDRQRRRVRDDLAPAAAAARRGPAGHPEPDRPRPAARAAGLRRRDRHRCPRHGGRVGRARDPRGGGALPDRRGRPAVPGIRLVGRADPRRPGRDRRCRRGGTAGRAAARRCAAEGERPAPGRPAPADRARRGGAARRCAGRADRRGRPPRPGRRRGDPNRHHPQHSRRRSCRGGFR